MVNVRLSLDFKRPPLEHHDSSVLNRSVEGIVRSDVELQERVGLSDSQSFFNSPSRPFKAGVIAAVFTVRVQPNRSNLDRFRDGP